MKVRLLTNGGFSKCTPCVGKIFDAELNDSQTLYTIKYSDLMAQGAEQIDISDDPDETLCFYNHTEAIEAEDDCVQKTAMVKFNNQLITDVMEFAIQGDCAIIKIKL